MALFSVNCQRIVITRASLVAQLVKNLPAMQEQWSIPGLGRSAGEGIGYPFQYSWASPVAQPPGTLLDRYLGPEFVGPCHRFSVVFSLSPDYHSCLTLIPTAPNASFLSKPTSLYAGISPHLSSSTLGWMSSPVCSHPPFPIFCPTKLCLDLYGTSDDQGLP